MGRLGKARLKNETKNHHSIAGDHLPIRPGTSQRPDQDL
jgi:hypothetical protein